MQQSTAFTDRSFEMDEKSWWDLWNSSFRKEDNWDEVSTELFGHVVRVIQLITGGAPPSILEVACGTGTLSRRLGFSSYHGLDLSAAAIEIAREKAVSLRLPAGATLPTYEAADFHEWPLPAEPFDLVLCVDAMSCFRDQQGVMRKLREGVCTGGYVVLTTVNPFVYNRLRRADGKRFQNGPVSHWLTRNELHGLIEKAGLRLEKSYTIMPRGNTGILRIVNSGKLERALGKQRSAALRKWKERAGFGQYRVAIARKVS